MSDYDAIVVGAGHNGLTAAVILQQAGLRTACLEANTYTGGMAATVELIDGFRYEIAGSVQFPMPSQIAKELGLDTLPTVDAEVMSVNLGDEGEEPMISYRDPMQFMTHLADKHGTNAVTGMAQMMSTPNLHEQRRRTTHEALRRAALASFARKGFANVTVTELAREAGVTERTFFRHFATKEAVLFQDYETQVEWLSAALAQRPVSESLFEAVLASVASFPHDLEVVRQAATARTEFISADRIASHLRVVQSSFAGVITDFIKCRYAETPDIDLVAEVAGAALAAALVVAVENWGRNGYAGDLGELTAAAVNLVRSGLAPLS